MAQVHVSLVTRRFITVLGLKYRILGYRPNALYVLRCGLTGSYAASQYGKWIGNPYVTSAHK